MIGVAGRHCERHVRDPGAALEAEDRLGRGAERALMRVTGTAISRELGSARFSGTIERAAVGGVAARLGVVVTRVQVEVARPSLRAARKPVRVGREAEVAEAEHEQPDDGEGDDAGGGEGTVLRGFMEAPWCRVG